MELINEPVKTIVIEHVDIKTSPCVKYHNKRGENIPYEWCKKCEFYDEETKSHKYYKYNTTINPKYRRNIEAEYPATYYDFDWKCPFCEELVTYSDDRRIMSKYFTKPIKCNKCGVFFSVFDSGNINDLGEQDITFAVSVLKKV